ncbi:MULTISPECIES: dipeptide ABC transporter ATP-binding protein [unclassified Bacillus (in: firmicutes)]|uniref:ABC transporter ATP-binding protein n=1 Tax=unclassified Bacillus (in: firmicutes) TaxID=185979 RepID=UPI001BEADC9B|nr:MULTISPECIES: dipeptide ABC transporter ATP-binding protein [unclassified Bacillus (in: firmicutes)]MBT2639650.1 dipeptide ABC transporter ATP-binding protein [Bacillus sp. ISL-39]MBT2661816.1 dipeptide ABC transporter ATP-binding protein [Bacillus sp. ISL-45]
MGQPLAKLPSENLLDVQDLKKHFPVGDQGFFGEKQVVKALDGITFTLKRGETLGIVGESGCGKSTMGRAILRLHEPSSGTIVYDGKDITNVSKRQMRDNRKDMQIIFQDPYGSLNPRMTVGTMLSEIVETHKIVSRKELYDYVCNLLVEVGLSEQHYYRFPHEFSGGQRQRVSIARALCTNPKLIVCDEAVSALDVSVQSQILNLLQRLKKEHQLTYLFISHDLSVVKHVSDRVAVMYLGKMVELADKKDLYDNPLHPYTKALLSAIPSTKEEKKRERVILKGDVPSPINVPSGCRFHTRCPLATDRCRAEEPAFREVSENHFASCHYA